MEENEAANNIIESINTAIGLPKCRKCGCMMETLKTINSQLSNSKNSCFSQLAEKAESAIGKMEFSEYS